MEKLKLEHLVAYLPYGLRIAYLDIQFKSGYEAYVLRGLSENYRYKKDDLDADDNLDLLKATEITFSFDSYRLNSIAHNLKPILRPLSDLDEEIDFDGLFVPSKWILKSAFNEGRYYEEDIESMKTSFDVNYTPYWLLRYLLEWHFDVFNLIEKGLAIDINALDL